MMSLDDQRAVVAGDVLCEILGIQPLTKIIVGYMRYSEAELVFRVLDSYNEPSCFLIDGPVRGPEDRGTIWINKYPSTENVAISWGWPSPFDSKSVGKLSIGFGGYWDTYNNQIHVTIDDLLPSRGLNINSDRVHGYEKEILDECREQFIARMRSEMDLI